MGYVFISFRTFIHTHSTVFQRTGEIRVTSCTTGQHPALSTLSTQSCDTVVSPALRPTLQTDTLSVEPSPLFFPPCPRGRGRRKEKRHGAPAIKRKAEAQQDPFEMVSEMFQPKQKNFAKRETSPPVFLVTWLFWPDSDLNVGGCRSGPKDSKNI